jgi:Cft2 family RNA processing exonuclease
VILTAETARLMQARLGGQRKTHLLPYGVPGMFGGAQFTLLPAGHICGAAQFYAETEHGSLLYTGDFKLRHSRTATSCQWRQADILIMETTFGLPKYRLPPQAEVERNVVAFCRESHAEGAVPVLFVYALGKAQEAVWALLENGLTPMLHPSVYKMTRLCHELQPAFPAGYEPWDVSKARGRVLLMPPFRASREALARKLPGLGPVRTAVLTGWALDPNARYRYQCDAAFPWSDHADYLDLLRYVELVCPRKVLTLHGFAAAFAADLRERGVEAWALSQENQLELALGLPVRG